MSRFELSIQEEKVEEIMKLAFSKMVGEFRANLGDIIDLLSTRTLSWRTLLSAVLESLRRKSKPSARPGRLPDLKTLGKKMALRSNDGLSRRLRGSQDRAIECPSTYLH